MLSDFVVVRGTRRLEWIGQGRRDRRNGRLDSERGGFWSGILGNTSAVGGGLEASNHGLISRWIGLLGIAFTIAWLGDPISC